MSPVNAKQGQLFDWFCSLCQMDPTAGRSKLCQHPRHKDRKPGLLLPNSLFTKLICRKEHFQKCNLKVQYYLVIHLSDDRWKYSHKNNIFLYQYWYCWILQYLQHYSDKFTLGFLGVCSILMMSLIMSSPAAPPTSRVVIEIALSCGE